jgi:hypothetical protein
MADLADPEGQGASGLVGHSHSGPGPSWGKSGESGPIVVSSKTGCCPASAMKLSTGSFWSAWKYCRVAEAILDVPLEHRPGLRPAHLPDGIVTFVAATSQPHLPGSASVVHPRHHPVRGDQPTPPVMLYNQDRVSACPAGPAPPRGQQVGVRHQTRTDERTHHRVLQTAPTARPVALPGAKPRRCRVGIACVSHAITLPPTGPATLHERYPRSRNDDRRSKHLDFDADE